MSSFTYDALVVLGAVMRGIVENGELKGWSFPDILEPEEYSGRLVLGEWRAEAAVCLQHTAPIILVTGGTNAHPVTGEKDFASRAVELRRVMVEMGVPEEKVLSIGKLGASHTLGNVANLGAYLAEHPEVKRIGIICPRFQMLRAMVMHSRDESLKGVEIDWIEVERTLMDGDLSWKERIDQIYTSPEADECYAQEERGMWDLLTGKYQTKKSA